MIFSAELNVAAPMGGRMINHLMYADDLVILSPSATGLQRLVDIYIMLPIAICMTLNLITPRLCVYLPSKGNCTLNSPLISLNLQTLSFVPKFVIYVRHFAVICSALINFLWCDFKKETKTAKCGI